MKNLTTIITAIFLLTSITTAQNYSLSFDGNDDYVNVGNTSSLTISGDITVSAWVYFDDFSAIPTVISKVTDGSNVGYGIEKKSQQDKLSFWIGDGTDFVDAISGVLSATTWYHVVGTNDGTNSKIYINGELEATVAQGNPAGPTGDLKIGLHSTQSQSYRYWDGLIDEISIWNVALNQEQIQSIMSSELSGDETGLVAYWNFNEGEGETLYDRSGNANHGTINGATWSDDVPVFFGCTDSTATNYNPDATIDDGSCCIELWNECYSIENTIELDLSYNELTGSIPLEIGNLANLERLYLNNNQLSGEIPPEIGDLTNLERLYLNYNQLIGSIPPEIGNLTNLTSLYLHSNQLTGIIPDEICNQGDSSPSLYNNQLCPPYPSCIEGSVGEQDTSDCP